MTAPRKKINPVWPILGCVVLISASLGIALQQTRALNHLLDEGERTEALVIGIDVGVKGGEADAGLTRPRPHRRRLRRPSP